MQIKKETTWIQLVVAVVLAAVAIIIIFGVLVRGSFDREGKQEEAQGDSAVAIIDLPEEERTQEGARYQDQSKSAHQDDTLGEEAATEQESSIEAPEPLLAEAVEVDIMPEYVPNHTLAFVLGVGEVTSSTAAISFSYDFFGSGSAEVTVAYEHTNGRRRTRSVTQELDPTQEEMTIVLTDLEPDTEYRYTVTIEDTNPVAPSVIQPTAVFRTQSNSQIVPVPVPTPPLPPVATPPYEVNEDRNIVYATPDGIELKANVYTPEGVRDETPVVVWVHGGGWDSGNRNGADAYARVLAQEGIAVVSVEYRLTTEGADYRDMVADIRSGIEFVYIQADTYNFDEDNITLLGTSAGGTLAALVGAGQEGSGARAFGVPGRTQRVKRVINVFGPTDFVTYVDHFGNTMTESRSASARQFIGGCSFVDYQDRECDDFVLASPSHYIDNDMPGFLTLHGDRDASVPIQQSVDFHQAVLASGASSQLLRSTQRGHDKGIILDYLEEVIEFVS